MKTIIDYKVMCRICLSEKDCIDITDENRVIISTKPSDDDQNNVTTPIKNAFFFFSSLRDCISEAPMICANCANRLASAYDFAMKVSESDKRFDESSVSKIIECVDDVESAVSPEMIQFNEIVDITNADELDDSITVSATEQQDQQGNGHVIESATTMQNRSSEDSGNYVAVPQYTITTQLQEIDMLDVSLLSRHRAPIIIKTADLAASDNQDCAKAFASSHQEQGPVCWLVNAMCNSVSADTLFQWLKIDHRVSHLQDCEFADVTVPQVIGNLKKKLDGISRNQVRKARKRCNAFEDLRHSTYKYGGAVKMEEIDELLDSMFTHPMDESGQLLNGKIYFADICGGPGGFSEYIFSKLKSTAMGIGFTLKRYNDFKFQHELFRTHYGSYNDGNIYNSANILSLERYVLAQTHDAGVHFVMADGGFNVPYKNDQEVASKQIYLCECLTALSILRNDGSFVVKLFDIFTRFSVGLVYLMYKCFKQICIIKPNTSRPANSERYLICKYKLSNTDTIRQHLFDINVQMNNYSASNIDTVELVPLDILTEDQGFFNYIVDSNNRIGKQQISALQKQTDFLHGTSNNTQ